MDDRERSARQRAVQGYYAQRYLDDLQALVKLDYGRRVLQAILRETGFYGTIGVGDPYGTAYTLGRRALGVTLRANLEAMDPLLPAQMEREYHIDLGQVPQGTVDLLTEQAEEYEPE